MNKELIIKALDGIDPFFVHEDKLYKKYDRIEFKPFYRQVEVKHGLFKSEYEDVYAGLVVSLYYGKTLVKEFRKHLYFESGGDQMTLCGIGGLIEFSVDEI